MNDDVELVLVDGAEIRGRTSTAPEREQELLASLNSAAMKAGLTARWRRAVSYSDAGPKICPGCGATRCWCGQSRNLTRRELQS